jgi:hypothetical protein
MTQDFRFQYFFLIFALLSLPVRAYAEPHPEESPTIWTLGGYTDLGIVAKNRIPGKANMLLNMGLGVAFDVDVSKRWRVGAGAGLAVPAETFSLALPLSARFFPFGAKKSGVYIPLQLTPAYTIGTPCAFARECDIPYPNEDGNGLYRALALYAKAGVGFQINFSAVWLFLDGSISSAAVYGIETKAGYKVSDGIYFGGEMALGVRVPLDP